MAENAESRLQETIPETEELERLGILSPDEVKELILKRKDQVYRISRISKNKEDYINTVNYEKKLLELIKIRRSQIKIFEKYQEIEGAIKVRAIKQCRFLTRHWPHHLDTWEFRIAFAKEVNSLTEVSAAYAEQVRHHGDNASVYVSWAQFEVDERSNFDTARNILLSKAALYHSKSPLIKKELFRLELLYVEFLQNKKQQKKAITEVIAENREKVMGCEIPRAIYKQALEEIPDPELYVELYKVADKFPFAHHIREEIYKDLSSAFPESESYLRLKVQRVISGKEPYFFSGKKSEENGEPAEEKPLLLAIDKLKATISMYDKILESVGTSFLNSYIDDLISLLHESWSQSDMADIIIRKLSKLFKAHISSLKPLHFIIWYQISLLDPKYKVSGEFVISSSYKIYPDLAPLQMEWFKNILEKPTKIYQRIAKVEKGALEAKGNYSLMLYNMLLSRLLDRKLKLCRYQSGAEHKDEKVQRIMRAKYMEFLNNTKPIKNSRSLYAQYCFKPPNSTKFHAEMVMGELTKKQGDLKEAKKVFDNAFIHHKKTMPGLWLAFIFFMKFHGDTLDYGKLYKEAEETLLPEKAEIFRQLNEIATGILNQKKKKGSKKKSKVPEEDKASLTLLKAEQLERMIDAATPEQRKQKLYPVLQQGIPFEHDKEDDEVECFEPNPPTVKLFEESPVLTHSFEQTRKSFFAKIGKMMKIQEEAHKEIPEEDGSEWEDVVEHLVGQRIPLSAKAIEEKQAKVLASKPKNVEQEEVSILKREKKKQIELSDKLNPGLQKTKASSKNKLDEILESSATLKPDFLQKTQLEPYHVGDRAAKAIHKRERNKTKGKGWYDMKKPELTEELKRDLEVLKMRSVLDPKRPFKNKDMDVMPKFFQMGKIIDSPLDFYSSRVNKKKRKRTMAEEIMNDEETLQYQKKKYNEIIALKQNKSKKRASAGKGKGDIQKKQKTNY